ncbi:alkaline-phosphatase-like protein [Lipomyces oligophaga]|uniref:alkaline-phosphatase-like protein n=1 Tax=Lipomyces oligophaga TaxID=45792 RepID=UPI0034CE07E9
MSSKKDDYFEELDMDGADITGDYRLRESDRDVLAQQDYAEKLITDAVFTSRKSALRKKGKSKKSVGFDIAPPAGGYKRLAGNDSTTDLDQEDVEVDAETHLKNLKKRQRRWVCLKTFCFTLAMLLIIGVIGAAGYIAFVKHKLNLNHWNPFKSSGSSSDVSQSKVLLNNGTHDVYASTILISLDGFRPDYLTPEYTPTMWEMFNAEYSTPYMLPSFPSVTFPNHYTLVTGLYPSSHGIVGNTFYDSDLDDYFNYHDPGHSLQSNWWKGEPIWVTASKNGVRSAIHMWPGSEAPWGDYEPEFVDKFNQTEVLSKKASRILGWLDLEIDTRPELILCYVPTIDTLGHKYGTLGPQIDAGLKEIDEMVSTIMSGLDERNMTSIINVVVVSDHGMASTANDRLIFLDDLIDTKLIQRVDGWPLYGLHPSVNSSAENLFNSLSASLQTFREQDDIAATIDLEHLQIYRREDLPAEWHFGGPYGGIYQDRIAPIWIVPEAGWAITTHDKFEASNFDFHPKGLHGYNNTHPLMRALFLATGPHFQSGFKAEPFYNTEVYEMICSSLNITAAPNNATLAGSPTQLPDDWMDPVQFPVYSPDAVIPTSTPEHSDKNPVPTSAADAMEYFQGQLDGITDDVNNWLDSLSPSDGTDI